MVEPMSPSPTDGSTGPRSVLVAVGAFAVGLLLGAGSVMVVAGGGEGDDGAWDEFCAKAVELDEQSGGDFLEGDAAADAFGELVDLAPPRYQEALAPLLEVDGDSTDDVDLFGEAFGAVLYLAAVLDVECGLTSDTAGGLGADGGAGFDLELGDDDGEPTGEDDPFGESPMDIDVMQDWLDEHHGDETWSDDLASWTVSGERDVVVSPMEGVLDESDALAVCGALSEYVFDHAPDGSVEVSDAAGVTQVRAEAGGPCEVVR